MTDINAEDLILKLESEISDYDGTDSMSCGTILGLEAAKSIVIDMIGENTLEEED